MPDGRGRTVHCHSQFNKQTKKLKGSTGLSNREITDDLEENKTMEA